MATPNSTARALLSELGRTFAEEAGIRLKDKPAPLFQLLCLALLLSAKIPAQQATAAARALKREGLSTPRKMADATWQRRVDVLTANGYKRYDESAARMLGSTAELVLTKYAGDLRKLRQQADGSVEVLRRLLKEFKGIGDVGVDIFLREVQSVWPEVYPFVDERTMQSAGRRKLPKESEALAGLVGKQDFSRLASALVRSELR